MFIKRSKYGELLGNLISQNTLIDTLNEGIKFKNSLIDKQREVIEKLEDRLSKFGHTRNSRGADGLV